MLTLITNRHLCGEDKFIEVVVDAVRAGVNQVILREKDLDTASLMEIGQIIKLEMKPWQNLIIHTDLEAAHALGADGVQMTYQGFMSLAPEDVAFIKEEMRLIVGVSVHSLEEARLAEEHGASYLIASHIFDTDCKAGTPGRGLSFIREICCDVCVPVIGLGGINAENVSDVISSGASGVAVMSGIMCACDVKNACEEIVSALMDKTS